MSTRERWGHVGRMIDFADAKAARLRAEAERATEIARRLRKLADDDTEGCVDESQEWKELLEKQLRACGEAPGKIGL